MLQNFGLFETYQRVRYPIRPLAYCFWTLYGLAGVALVAFVLLWKEYLEYETAPAGVVFIRLDGRNLESESAAELMQVLPAYCSGTHKCRIWDALETVQSRGPVAMVSTFVQDKVQERMVDRYTGAWLAVNDSVVVDDARRAKKKFQIWRTVSKDAYFVQNAEQVLPHDCLFLKDVILWQRCW